MKLLLLVCLCVYVVYAENPALRVRITDKVLRTLKQKAPKITDEFLRFVNKQIQRKSPGGSIKLTNNQVFSNAELQFVPPNELQLRIKNASVNVEMVFPGIANGTVTLEVSGINVDIAIGFGRQYDQRLKFDARCSSNMTTDFQLEGIPHSNTVLRLMRGRTAEIDALPRRMCAKLDAVMRKLNMLPYQQDLTGGIGNGPIFDVKFVNDPVATSDYLQFDISGQISVPTTPQPIYLYEPMSTAVDNSKMFYIWYNPVALNSRLKELHENAMFNKTVDRNDPKLYAKAKKTVKELMETLGETTVNSNDIEVTIKSVDAPQIIVHLFNNSTPISVTFKNEMRVKTPAKTVGMVIAGRIDFAFRTRTIEVSELSVESITGIQQANVHAAQELLKRKLEESCNEAMRKIDHDYNKMMRSSWGQVMDFDNASFKVVDQNTMEMSFDIIPAGPIGSRIN